MQTTKKENQFGIALYGLVLCLMLASAITGAMVSQHINLPVPAAFRENQPEEVEIVPMDSSSNGDMLRQELLAIHRAEAHSIPVQSSNISSLHEKRIQILTLKERMLDVQIPEELIVTFPTWQELRKEHLDFLESSQGGLQQNEAKSDPDAGRKTQSAYDLYWAGKAEQIK